MKRHHITPTQKDFAFDSEPMALAGQQGTDFERMEEAKACREEDRKPSEALQRRLPDHDGNAYENSKFSVAPPATDLQVEAWRAHTTAAVDVKIPAPAQESQTSAARQAALEDELRAIWNKQGVSQKRQDELLAGPLATCGATLAKAFGMDKLPANCVRIVPD